MIIALDVGHANKTGASSGLHDEHEHCTRLAEALQAAFTLDGHTVHVFDFPEMSNTADLNASIKAINALPHCDLVISLHMDASDNSEAQGAHVIYVSSAGKLAAECFAPELVAFFPGRYYSTVQRSDLAILNQTKWPAILSENGFVTSTKDAYKMSTLLDDYVAVYRAGLARYVAVKGASA